MAAIGKTYPKTCRPIPLYIGMRLLDSQVREQVKKAKWTTLMIIDSQAVKNTCNASIESLIVLFLQQMYKWY
jgi:hypothetical protein